MVKSVIDDITTYYPRAAYQVKSNGTDTNTRKYYSFNGAVVAMRENGVVTWLLQDQVNSTTITTDANGNLLSETRYSAFGEIRYSNGTTLTDKLYTGQQQEMEIGLSYYIARFYDPVIAHFIQPDSLIPQASASASFDRYVYVNGNPVNFNDPTGNIAWLPILVVAGAAIGAAVDYGSQVYNNYQNNGGNFGAALTTNINLESIGKSALTGAAIGLTVAVAAPVAVALVGEGLTGVGLLTGSTAIFGAGIAANQGATNLANMMVGTSSITTPPKAPIIGKPQVTSDPFHASTSASIAEEYSQLPSVNKVFLNRPISTITGGQVPSSLRPDVAVRYTDGSYGFTEIVSRSQTVISQTQKMDKLAEILYQFGKNLIIGNIFPGRMVK